MIWLVSSPLLAVASLFYVFWLPRRLFVDPATTRSGYLRERKKAVYDNLRDLNFEYEAGKVADVDYAPLKSSLQDEAVTILAEIARLETSSATSGRRTAAGRTRQ